MPRGFNVNYGKFVDNSPEELERVADSIVAALTECGLEGERTAKQRCPVANPSHWKVPVPRSEYMGGTLRNSITFAIDGESPKSGSYKVEKGNTSSGKYNGTAAKEKNKNRRSVYIGTNVYYAPYVEMGTEKMAARPFIRPAFVENQGKFRAIFEKWLKKP